MSNAQRKREAAQRHNAELERKKNSITENYARPLSNRAKLWLCIAAGFGGNIRKVR